MPQSLWRFSCAIACATLSGFTTAGTDPGAGGIVLLLLPLLLELLLQAVHAGQQSPAAAQKASHQHCPGLKPCVSSDLPTALLQSVIVSLFSDGAMSGQARSFASEPPQQSPRLLHQ